MKKILYFLCLLPLLSTGQNLKINEIMVKNVSSYYDEGYNFSAWVEVYNTGAATENLQDYTFSRTTKTGVKTWTPGSISVPAGGYAVVFFERQDSVYYMAEPRTSDGNTKTDYYNEAYLKSHASFKLDNPSSEGTGELILLKGDAQIDKVTYPKQYRNISYGRTTDGGATFAFFTEPSPAATNAGKASVAPAEPADLVTAAPVFSVTPGYYTSAQNVALTSATTGATIYYETFTGPTKTQTATARLGKEPTTASTQYSSAIAVANSDANKAVVIRAFAVAPGKLPSEIVTGTYFVNTHSTTLPTISLTIDELYMYDAEEGMYDPVPNGNHRVFRVHDGAINADGTSHTEGCNARGNFGNPWDRPANFEFFDKNGVRYISQEVDLGVAGQCTRQNNWFKSLKVKAKDKFSNDKLEYDFFASKPGHKYESVMLRWAGTEGSGTINGTSWMRDAFMAELSIGFMETEVQAYQPAVIYVNGEYWGLVNLRERTNDSNVYSSYGISGSDVYVVENFEIIYPTPGPITGTNKIIPYEPYEKKKAFDAMKNAIVDQDLTDPAKYAAACELLDIDSYIDNLLLGVYGQNWDWPQNNLKLWRPVAEGGKWRYLSYDNDFAVNNGDFLCGGYRTFDGVKNNSGGCGNELSSFASAMLTSLYKSPEFKARFLTRAYYHSQNTFKATRLTAMVDGFKLQIQNELPLFYSYRGRTDDWAAAISTVRNFANSRVTAFWNEAKAFIGGSEITINVKSNVAGAKAVVNGLTIANGTTATQFQTSGLLPNTFEAKPLSGYKFVKWQHDLVSEPVSTEVITTGSEWDYAMFGQNTPYPAGWPNVTSLSASGPSPLGYGSSAQFPIPYTAGTVLPKTDNQNCVYIGACFVKKLTIPNISNVVSLNAFVRLDDALICYVNGTEVFRTQSFVGKTVTNKTEAGNYDGDAPAEFSIPASVLVAGDNYIQVEVHQGFAGGGTNREGTCATSSDLGFDMVLTMVENDPATAVDEHLTAEYKTTLGGNYTTTAIYEVDPDANPKDVRINEVYSAGTSSNEDADWIELYNAETSAVDLSGYVLSRTDDGNITKTWTIPAGASIPAGGSVVLSTDKSGLSFGISHSQFYTVKLTDKYDAELDVFEVADSALFTAEGESVEHSNHDGTGALVVKTNPTKDGDDVLIVGIKVVTDKTAAAKVTIFPNPIKDAVNVRSESPIRSIVITDIAGRTVVNKTSNSTLETIPTETLSSGVYLISVETETGKAVKKVIK